MRPTAMAMAAAAALAGTICLAPGAWALSNCSDASLSGSYSARFAGAIGRLPLAGAGILTFNGAGTVSGALAFNKDGNFFTISPSGPYQVFSNCVGTMSLGSQHFTIGVNSTGFVGVQTDFGTAVTIDGRP